MTTKTVQQIVDEYLNRQKKAEFASITFDNSPVSYIESHDDVSNVYRDGIMVTELSLDSGFHTYQFDKHVDAFLDEPAHYIRVTFRGKVIGFSQKTEE